MDCIPRDIPVLLGEASRVVQERYRLGQSTWRNPTEKRDKRVWYSASIGSETAPGRRHPGRRA